MQLFLEESLLGHLQNRCVDGVILSLAKTTAEFEPMSQQMV